MIDFQSRFFLRALFSTSIHLDEIIRCLHNNNMDNFRGFIAAAEAFIKLGLGTTAK